jgi:hypothetical protein
MRTSRAITAAARMRLMYLFCLEHQERNIEMERRAYRASLTSSFCTGGGGGPALTYGGGVMEEGTLSGGDTSPFRTSARRGRDPARLLSARSERMQSRCLCRARTHSRFNGAAHDHTVLELQRRCSVWLRLQAPAVNTVLRATHLLFVGFKSELDYGLYGFFE